MPEGTQQAEADQARTPIFQLPVSVHLRLLAPPMPHPHSCPPSHARIANSVIAPLLAYPTLRRWVSWQGMVLSNGAGVRVLMGRESGESEGPSALHCSPEL